MKSRASILPILCGICLLFGVLFLYESQQGSLQGKKMDAITEKKQNLKAEHTMLSAETSRKRGTSGLNDDTLTEDMTQADFVHLEVTNTVAKEE